MANVVDIIVNATDRASQVLGGIGGQFDSLHGKAQKASAIIGGVMAGAGAVFLGVAVAGVKVNKTLESSKAKWTTLTGSVEGANKQLSYISDYAKASPFDFKGVDETATSLMGMGMEIKDVNKWIPTLGDMASVMGGGTETIKGVGTALGQMTAKGKVSAEEMGQLAERGVNGWQMLADGMGMTVGQVRKLSEDGELLASDALPMIYDGMNKAFGGGTAQYMKTTAGQWDNLTEGAEQFAGQLTSGAYDWFGSTVLPKLNSALDVLSGMFEGGLKEGFSKLFDSKYIGIIIAIAGVILGAMVGALVLIAPAITTAVIAFAPFLAIGLLIAGLALIIMKNWGTIKPFLVGIFEAIKPAVMSFKTTFMQAFTTLKAGIMPIWESIKTLITSLMPIIQLIIAVVVGLLVTSVATFMGIVSAIAPLVNAFLNLVDIIVNVVMAIVKVFTGDWKGAMESWNRATQSSIEFFKNIWKAIVGFFTGFWNTIVNLFSAYGVNVNKIFSDMWNSVVKAVGKGVTAVVKFFVNLGTSIMTTVASIGVKVLSGFTKAMTGASKAVSSGVKAVTTFFKTLGTTIASTITGIGAKISSGFISAMSKGKSAVSNGVKNIISAITGFGSTFVKSGLGLLTSFTKGITQGISKAVDAVKGGMKKIRDFLPFSPAKKGALSDLDKSGESFFPTWYGGALKKVKPMTKAIGGAMSLMNDALQADNGNVALEAFSGGRASMTVKHIHDHNGQVTVKGDSGKESFEMVGKSVRETTESDVMKDLRQAIRKR